MPHKTAKRATARVGGWMQLCCHRNKAQSGKAQWQERDYQLGNCETLSLKWKAFCLPCGMKDNTRRANSRRYKHGELRKSERAIEGKCSNVCLCVCSARCTSSLSDWSVFTARVCLCIIPLSVNTMINPRVHSCVTVPPRVKVNMSSTCLR